MGRHRAPRWFAWLRRIEREQAQAGRELTAARTEARLASIRAEQQVRRSVGFVNELNRFLERHT